MSRRLAPFAIVAALAAATIAPAAHATGGCRPYFSYTTENVAGHDVKVPHYEGMVC